jgi:hypothetical protein
MIRKNIPSLKPRNCGSTQQFRTYLHSGATLILGPAIIISACISVCHSFSIFLSVFLYDKVWRVCMTS